MSQPVADLEPVAATPDDLQPVTTTPDDLEPVATTTKNFDPGALITDPERAHQHATPRGKRAIELLYHAATDDSERKLSAAQIYVQQRNIGLSDPAILKNWGAVRDSYAKRRLGYTGNTITDEKFNGLLQQEEKKNKQAEWAKASPMERVKLMFGDRGGLTDPDFHPQAGIPMIGSESAGTKGGAFTIPKMQGTGAFAGIINAVNRASSGLTSPSNVALMVGTAGLGEIAAIAESAKVIAVAKTAQAATLGTFTAIGAKDTVQALGEAHKVTLDPKSTHADKADAWSTAALSFLMTAGAAKGTFDFAESAGKTAGKSEGKAAAKPAVDTEKVTEAANLLREEAKTAPTVEIAATLGEAADHIEMSKEEPKGKDAEKEASPTKDSILPPNRVPVKALTNNEGGIAHRVSEGRGIEADRGKGISSKESVEHGRELLAKGEDPEAAIAKFEKDHMISDESMALVRAHKEVLEKRTNAAEDKFGPDSPEYQAAINREKEWVAKVKPMQTVWSRAGMAQGGSTNIDTGTVSGMQRAVEESTGRDLTEPEKETIKKKVSKVKKASEEVAQANKDFVEKAKTIASGESPRRARVSKVLSDRVIEARGRIAARLEKLVAKSVVAGPDVGDFFSKENLDDLAVVAAEYIAKGVDAAAGMVKEFGDKISPHLEAILAKAGEVKEAMESEKIRGAIDERKKRIKARIDVLKEKIETGDLSAEGKKAGRPEIEEIERLQQERDALSGELTSLRENATKEKELREAITEKERKIKEGDLSSAPGKVNRPSMPEIEKLKQERDALNKELSALRKPKPKTETEKAAGRLDKQIEELERQIKSGEIFPEGKTPKAKDPALADKQARLDELKYERENMRQIIQPDADPIVKPTTAETVAEHVPGSKWTPEHAKALWQHAKDKYLDQGITDPHALRNNLATDFGLDPSDIHEGLSSPKGMREITDDLYKKQAAQRRVINESKRWVAEAKYPGYQKIFRNIPDNFFSIVTFGHGTSWVMTHTANQIFLPKATGALFRDLGRSFRMMGVQAYHERMMQDLVRDENFVRAKRAGLNNDPYKQTDEYQNPGVVKVFRKIGMAGNRGFDGMKLFRQFRFNQEWEALPDVLKTDEMAQELAKNINTATGSMTGGKVGGKLANTIFFAPRKVASEFKFLFKDPVKDTATIASHLFNKDSVTPEEYQAAQRNMRMKLTIAGVYFGALAVNQGLLHVTDSDEEVNFTDFKKGDWLDFKGFGKSVGPISTMRGSVQFVMRLGADLWGERTKFQQMEGTRAQQTGEHVLEFGRQKLAPWAAVATDILTQADYIGKPMPYSSEKASMRAKRMGESKPYTYAQYGSEHILPIPLTEAAREIWTQQGMNEDEVAKYIRAMEAGTAAFLVGARLKEDKPKKPTGRDPKTTLRQ